MIDLTAVDEHNHPVVLIFICYPGVTDVPALAAALEDVGRPVAVMPDELPDPAEMPAPCFADPMVELAFYELDDDAGLLHALGRPEDTRRDSNGDWRDTSHWDLFAMQYGARYDPPMELWEMRRAQTRWP